MNTYKTVFNAQRELMLLKEEVAYPVTSLSEPELVTQMMNQIFRLADQTEEYLYCIVLNTRLDPVGIFEVSHGTVNGTILDTRSILQKTLLIGGTCFILTHNHPSGNVTPSKEDIASTNALAKAAEIVGLRLMDHVIIGSFGRFCSMKESAYLEKVA